MDSVNRVFDLLSGGFVVVGLIGGAFGVWSLYSGSKSGNPDKQEQGTWGIIGMGAGVVIGGILKAAQVYLTNMMK